MTRNPLTVRLARSTPREAPDPALLLERAFPETERLDAGGPKRAVLAAATAALTVAATTPAWVAPTRAERERTETFIAATVATMRTLDRELNQRGDER